MKEQELLKTLGLGAVAGLAGTVAIQAVLTPRLKRFPETAPPMKEEPGRFMVRQFKHALPESVQTAVSPKTEALLTKLLPVGYGMTFGVLYAAARRATKPPLWEGVLLGLATWAVGYLGWLPATRLTTPVWKHKPKQLIPPIIEHALYGVAAVATYRGLKQRLQAT